MTIAQICLLLACLLPLACTGLAKSKGLGKPRREGGFDNHNPRAWLATLDGWHARANAAQSNSWEALPIFVAAQLVADQHGAVQATVDALSMVFIAARVGFIGFYLADQATPRSLCWTAGLAACIALFFVR